MTDYEKDSPNVLHYAGSHLRDLIVTHPDYPLLVLAGPDAVILSVLCYALSWGAVVGVVRLITLCFGWPFSLTVATGIWLVLQLIRWVLSACKSDNK